MDDLLKRAARFAQQCGSCDLGLPQGCNCPTGDSRPIVAELIAEVERLREHLGIIGARRSVVASEGSGSITVAIEDGSATKRYLQFPHVGGPADPFAEVAAHLAANGWRIASRWVAARPGGHVARIEQVAK